MNRPKLRGFGPACLAGLALLSLPAAALLAQEARPPIILITIDTLRADHVGAYGYEKARTPNLDALAASGIRFENAFTPVPITLPSHSVMLTGTYPMRTGMRDFSGNRLAENFPTLAEILKQAGYATGAVVSAPVLDSSFGLARGFDSYVDDFDYSLLPHIDFGALARRADSTVDAAIEWLGTTRQNPFFLWVHLFDPHHPYTPPAPYNEQFRENLYDGEIAFTDAQVGRLIAYLKEREWFDEALIVLAGDHGEGLGQHGEKTHGFFVYTSTLHVPLILKPPADHKLRPRAIPTPVTLVDLMPTILRLAGMRVPPGVQGRSLLPLIRGERLRTQPQIYSESFLPRLHFNWSELQSIQYRGFHYIDAPRPELYDLGSDPGELNNLFKTRPRIAGDLRGRLAKMIQEYSPPSGEETAGDSGLDPELMEQLKSLGYAAVSSGGSATLDKRELPDPKDRIKLFDLVSDAIVHSQGRRYRNSNAKLLLALETEPDSVPIRFLLATNYYRMGRLLKSIEEFQVVLANDPDHVQANYYAGLARGKSGDRKGAIVSLRKTLEFDPNHHAAAYNLGVVFMQEKQFEKSATLFRKATALFPGYAQAHAALGDVLLYQGRVDEAIESFQEALRLVPNNRKVRRSLVNALKSQGLEREAEQVLRGAGPPPSR